MVIGSALADCAAAQPPPENAAAQADEEADPDAPRTPALRDTTFPSKRKVPPMS